MAAINIQCGDVLYQPFMDFLKDGFTTLIVVSDLSRPWGCMASRKYPRSLTGADPSPGFSARMLNGISWPLGPALKFPVEKRTHLDGWFSCKPTRRFIVHVALESVAIGVDETQNLSRYTSHAGCTARAQMLAAGHPWSEGVSQETWAWA